MKEKVEDFFVSEGTLYRNTGKKIMIFAKIFSWLVLIAGIIIWICYITNKGYYSSYLGMWLENSYNESDDWIGWVSLAAGFFAFISSWFVYGYGQIVDDIHTIKTRTIGNSNINNEKSPEL